MKKLYEKNELVFAILWIVVYVVSAGTVRGNFGDDSPILTALLAVLCVLMIVFVKANRLEEKYGLCKWKGKAGAYLFFIPMLILATGPLWGGFGFDHNGMGQAYAAVSMVFVGVAEEMIFRGFLFRILLKKDPVPVAIIISAVTFGIGHIVNLLTGQANIATVVQVFFAVAWGFIFTFVFYKSGSLIMCIIVHSVIDLLSKFNGVEGDQNTPLSDYIYMGATIVVALVYCAYLSRKPAALEKE